MEKLGVVLDDEKAKTASTQETCPQCGRKLQHLEGDTMPWCRNCGTEPFEKRPEKKSQ